MGMKIEKQITDNLIGYMVSPLGLTEKQMLIYQKLYEKCNFTDMTVKYTLEQLSADIKIINMDRSNIHRNIKSMVKSGYLQIIIQGRKGFSSTYKITKISDLMCKLNANYMQTERKLKHSHNAGLTSDSENCMQTKRKLNANPIKEKEKEKEYIYRYIDLTFIDDSIDKVHISQEQYTSLINKFEPELVNSKILELDNYITNGNGIRYRDHYKVLNNWCKDTIQNESSKHIYINRCRDKVQNTTSEQIDINRYRDKVRNESYNRININRYRGTVQGENSKQIDINRYMDNVQSTTSEQLDINRYRDKVPNAASEEIDINNGIREF